MNKLRIKQMKGFTLVELLIVIALIAILSVAVLATINPIEQANKAKDSSTQNDAAEVLNAYERFYANANKYPWEMYTKTVPALSVDSSIFYNSTQAGFGICYGDVLVDSANLDAKGACNTTGAQIGVLSEADELKPSFAGKAAFKNPGLISELALAFGSQCVVLAIDAKKGNDGKYYVHLNGGRVATEITCLDWAKRAVDLGVGEILLTSMDHDGTKSGFAVDITRLLAETLPVPVIASGGGGTREHFSQIFMEGKADAALAASIFHFREIPIPSLKEYLKSQGINIRI